MQRAALLTLFVSREHAKQIVFWSDGANLSPALPMPVHPETLVTLEKLFRARPDGWESWFARFPASSGLVALTRPVVPGSNADGIGRVTVVGARTCGEHCHSAWRVTVVRDAGRSWRTRAVEPLTLSRDQRRSCLGHG